MTRLTEKTGMMQEQDNTGVVYAQMHYNNFDQIH